MSQENVETVRSMWEAFLESDAERTLAAFHPEVEWDGRNLPDGRIAHGIGEVIDHVMKWAAQWQDWGVELEQVVDAGDDNVVVIMRETGRSATGLVMNERHAEVYTVRDDLIVARVGYSDPAEALEAVGLSD
jgi:ketosteroid isomerase-like protein